MPLIAADLVAGRFLVRVRLPDDAVVRFLADTGGGLVVDPDRVAALPTVPFLDGAGQLGVRLPLKPPIPVDRGVAFLMPAHHNYDGVLGAAGFADRVWVFDYAAGRLELLQHPPKTAPIPLGFQHHDGRRTTHFPRIWVTIADESFSLLLDTGANITLTPNGLGAIGGGPRHRATSFLITSVLDRWRHQHPDWPVIESASRIAGANLIQVPHVEIHGTVLGPVWFEERADANFHDWMSQWMDHTVDGALGGNAFTGRRLTINYPGASATVT